MTWICFLMIQVFQKVSTKIFPIVLGDFEFVTPFDTRGNRDVFQMGHPPKIPDKIGQS